MDNDSQQARGRAEPQALGFSPGEAERKPAFSSSQLDRGAVTLSSNAADGTKAVTEIREPGFVTCVWWCLGSPCFNKHLDAERGACPLRRSLVEITNALHHDHTTHVLVMFLWKCFCPKQTFPQSLTGASPLCRPAAAS
ncbi:hypothetical protein CRENBAI_019951 [Crenichthys baileyi]|uniref:Uncharacterized protein n=1 Tax=Crenichthys baileyi TaxID=28760 RepID=A0AAV9QS88_9TELE